MENLDVSRELVLVSNLMSDRYKAEIKFVFRAPDILILTVKKKEFLSCVLGENVSVYDTVPLLISSFERAMIEKGIESV